MHQCDIVKVVQGLYISDMHASNNKQLLNDLSIKHIIVVGSQLKCFYPKDFNYLHIQIKDSIKEPILDHFPNSNTFIEKAFQKKQPVLVHCAFGKSRSAAIIVAYLMYRYKMQYQEALNFLKRKRREVSPNQGFITQLKKYEQILIQAKNQQKK